MDVDTYTELSDLLNTFTEKAKEYGYYTFDDVMDAMQDFERHDPRRYCNYCNTHIYDRTFAICNTCNKSYHERCFNKHVDDK